MARVLIHLYHRRAAVVVVVPLMRVVMRAALVGMVMLVVGVLVGVPLVRVFVLLTIGVFVSMLLVLMVGVVMGTTFVVMFVFLMSFLIVVIIRSVMMRVFRLFGVGMLVVSVVVPAAFMCAERQTHQGDKKRKKGDFHRVVHFPRGKAAPLFSICNL